MNSFALSRTFAVGFAPVLGWLLVSWQTSSAQEKVGDVSKVRPMLERLDSESQNGLRDALEIFQSQNSPKDLGETALLGLGLVHLKLADRDHLERWERSLQNPASPANRTRQLRLQLCLDSMQKDAIDARSHFIDLMRAVLTEELDKTTSELNGDFLGSLLAMQESPNAPKILPAEILKAAHSRLLLSKNRPLCTAYQLSFAKNSNHFRRLQEWYVGQAGVPDAQIEKTAKKEILECREQVDELEKSLAEMDREKDKVDEQWNQLKREQKDLEAQYKSILGEIQSNPHIYSPIPPNYLEIRARIPKSRYSESSSVMTQTSGVPRFVGRGFRSRPPSNFSGNQNVIVQNLAGWMARPRQEIDSEAAMIYAQQQQMYLSLLEQRRLLMGKKEGQQQLIGKKQDEIKQNREEGNGLEKEGRKVRQQAKQLEQQIGDLELFAKAGKSGDIGLIFHSPLYELLNFTREKEAILATP